MASERASRLALGAEESFEFAAISTASASDVGRVRSANQDACCELDDPLRELHVLFVADGMGGHRGGEVASRIAVEGVSEIFETSPEPPDNLLTSAFARANERIFETASADPALRGMGTTGVALALTGARRAVVAHVGDSRAYRLRGGDLTQITGDHSVVGELVRRGQLTPEQARVHPQSNEILRALGTQPEVEVEITPLEVEPGDRYLLCSDGLSGMLPDDAIREVLAREDAAEAVRTLIARANEAGGTDNITVQIAIIPERFENTAPAEPAGQSSGRGRSPLADLLAARAGWLLPVAVLLLILFAYLVLQLENGN